MSTLSAVCACDRVGVAAAALVAHSVGGDCRRRSSVASRTQATKFLDEDDWKGFFSLSDTKGKGSLSFSEFRRAVRRANIKPSAISDEDLVSIVKMVDTDGSGFIELGEFLSFLRPEHVPDIECRASSWVSMFAAPMCMPVWT